MTIALAGGALLGGVAAAFAAAKRVDDTARRAGVAAAGHARAEVLAQQATWLHDEVCAHLRELRLRAQSLPGCAELAGWIDRFEHDMRIRQLDHLLGARPVTVAEVLQPFVRLAVGRGIAVDGLPDAATAAVELPEPDARRLRHAVAVTVTNAVHAGASRLQLNVNVHATSLVVRVLDDAGGFEQQPEHRGRGLDSLRREHGDAALAVRRTTDGTEVVVTIIRDAG